jgi:ABC-type phosphate transport system permease subunit
MRAIAKPILLLAAILLAIPLGIIISLNIYLQSKETRERLISALSSQLGVPVTIRGTFGLPLGGIRIHGISGR